MKGNVVIKCWNRGYIPCLIILSAIIFLLKLSWLRWGDLIIDSGREMYVPFALSRGALLYRDIFYLYWPFSPYFNALIFKISGPTIYSLVAGGILSVCAASLLVYKLCRFFLNAFFSTFVVLAFLFVFAFGYYVYLGNYNFIIPYSYPAVHSIIFSLAAFFFYFSFLRYRSRADGLPAGLFVFLALLTRIEMGFILGLTLLSGIAVYRTVNRVSVARFIRETAVFVGLPFIAAAVVYGFFLALSLKTIAGGESGGYIVRQSER